jgi:hypothetical protein
MCRFVVEFNGADVMELTKEIHTRLSLMEDLAARKSRDLYNILRQDRVPIKELIQSYFEPPSSHSVAVEDLSAKHFLDASEDRDARAQIRTLLNSIDGLSSGREVARILHGLGEKGVDSSWWRKGRHLEYRSLVELANRMILSKVDEK